MTGLLFIAVVGIAVLLILLNGKVNALTRENAQLKFHINQLWGYLQQGKGPQPPASYPQAPPSPAPPVYPQYAQPPIYTPPQANAQSSAVPYSPTPKAPATAYSTPSPAVPQQNRPKSPAPAGVGSPGSMENWVGRNVLGIAASILFFVGIIVFAVWIYNSIPEPVKIFLMYFISAGITAAGILLAARRRNHFTLILTGCGCGLLFISILLTRAYFGRLNDPAAFTLLLIWLIAALILAKGLNSTLISMVAHAGMGISLCFAYGMALSEEKLPMLLVYQAASIAVILVGNMICCKRTYRFGLFLSLGISLVAGAGMLARFSAANIPGWGVTAAFFVQFLCASFLSYLLSVSTARLQNFHTRLGVHIANKVLWVAALCTQVLPAVYRLAYAGANGLAFRPAVALNVMTATGIAVLLIHGIISIYMRRTLHFDRKLETVSVLASGSLSALLLFIAWAGGILLEAPVPRLPLLLFPAALLLWAGFAEENRAYRLAANLLLILDWFLMVSSGFRALTLFGTIALPLLYTMLYVGFLWLQWLLESAERKGKLFLPYRTITYYFLQISAFCIFSISGYRNWLVILLLALIVFNLLLCVFRYDRGAHSYLSYGMRAVEGVLLTVSAGVIAWMPHGGAGYLLLSLAVVSVIYAFFRTPFTLGHSVAEDLCTGLKFTVLVLAAIQGFTPWFASGYAATLTAMASALLCLAVGYRRKALGLIRYALIAAVFCAAVLLFIQIPFWQGLNCVVPLFFGSLLFFLMHLLYEKFDHKEQRFLTILLRVAQYSFLAVSAVVIAFSPQRGSAETTLRILLTALSFLWAFRWTPETLGSTAGRETAVWEGVKLTVLVLATVQGYTDWFADAYCLSLACMLTALLCIITGFFRQVGSLRLYGLVLALVCVLKLVTWDVAGQETVLRILSLIGGGVICFAISAIYSYSVKRLPATAPAERADGEINE